LLTLHGAQGPRRGSDLNELGVIHDGALLVRDGIVQQVGPSRRVENLAEARDAVEVSAVGRVIMPGFVDSHTHLLSPPPDAGEAELKAAASMVRTSSAKRLAARARKHLEAMARHGTTTVEVKIGCCGADDSVDIKLLRVLAALRDNPLDVVSTFLFHLPPDGAARQDAVERVCGRLLPKVCGRRLARFADVDLDGDGGCGHLFERFLHAAGEAGMGLKIHAVSGGYARAVALANGYRAVSVDHVERAAAEEVPALGGFGGIATILPGSAFRQARPDARGRDLIDAGAAIALASNFNPQHTPALNLQSVIALASMQMGLTVAEAISAVTINAAYAAGCADRVGSLEVGKTADLLVLNIADYRELAEQFGMNLVHLTMKRGAFIYKEGAVAPLKAEELKARW